MSLDNRILEMIKNYMGKLVHKKVLKTMEEVEANTNETNLVAAQVVAELSNKLAGQPEFVYDDTGKITGYKTPGGADAVFPFSSREHYVISTDYGIVDNFIQIGADGGIKKYQVHGHNNSNNNLTEYAIEYEHFTYYSGTANYNVVQKPSSIVAKVPLKYAQSNGGTDISLSTLSAGSKLQLYNNGRTVNIIWQA